MIKVQTSNEIFPVSASISIKIIVNYYSPLPFPIFQSNWIYWFLNFTLKVLTSSQPVHQSEKGIIVPIKTDLIVLDLKHDSLVASSSHSRALKTWFLFSSAWKSHIRSELPSPDWPIAPNSLPSLYGDITCAPTERPPAEQPKIVIRSLSPPKYSIFR